MRAKWLNVGGRRVKLYAVDPVNGRQSVNVCTAANKPGKYEARRYFPKGHHVKITQGQYTNLDDFREAVDKLLYRIARKI